MKYTSAFIATIAVAVAAPTEPAAAPAPGMNDATAVAHNSTGNSTIDMIKAGAHPVDFNSTVGFTYYANRWAMESIKAVKDSIGYWDWDDGYYYDDEDDCDDGYDYDGDYDDDCDDYDDDYDEDDDCDDDQESYFHPYYRLGQPGRPGAQWHHLAFLKDPDWNEKDDRVHYYRHDARKEHAPRPYPVPYYSKNDDYQWQAWEYDAEYDGKQGWKHNDQLYGQKKSRNFWLEVRDRDRHSKLSGKPVQALPDGALGVNFGGYTQRFWGAIGLESQHLFHTGIKKPFGVVGGQNLLHTVASFKVAARPWLISNHRLMFNRNPHAVACPLDGREEEFILHWGEEWICPGGRNVELITHLPSYRDMHKSHHYDSIEYDDCDEDDEDDYSGRTDLWCERRGC